MPIAWPWTLPKGHPLEPDRKAKWVCSRAKEPQITQPLQERATRGTSDTNLWTPRQISCRAVMTKAISQLSTTSYRPSKSPRLPATPISTQFTRIPAPQISNNMGHRLQARGQLSAEAPRKRPLRQNRGDSWSHQDSQTESSLHQLATSRCSRPKGSAPWRVMSRIYRRFRKYIHRRKNWSQPFSISRSKTLGSKPNLSPKMQLGVVTTFTMLTHQARNKTERSFLRKSITSMMMSKSPKPTERMSWKNR